MNQKGSVRGIPKREANSLSLREAAGAIESGGLTVEELIRSCLERIQERNAELKAFVSVCPDKALELAREYDQQQANRRILHGLPFAIKDVIETAEFPTEYGSPIYKGFKPRNDAACVAMAKENGGLVLGKVATGELATQSPSDTRNPLDLQRTPGGSSGGSAAAVADRMVPVAFGTQTTASTIRPAVYCGIVGFKPTFGFFVPAGMKPLSPSQDTVTLLARNVSDAAFFSFGVHGQKLDLDVPELNTIRVAVGRSTQWGEARAESIQAVERAARVASKAGASVKEVVLPQELEEIVSVQGKVFSFEARQSLAHERHHDARNFTERLAKRLAGGEGISIDQYLALRRKLVDARALARQWFHDMNIDVLLYPAADGEAEMGIKDAGSPRFGAIWTPMHVPCVSLPADSGPNGLPVGVQVIGTYASDRRTLEAAAAMEAALSLG